MSDNHQTSSGTQYPPMCAGYTKFFTLTDSLKHPEDKAYPTLSWLDLVALADAPMQVEKDLAKWVIPSTCHNRMARTKYEQLKNGDFWALGGDIDEGNLTLQQVLTGLSDVLDAGTNFLIYASKSSIKQRKKWRVIVPTAGGIMPDAFHHVANLFNEALGIALGVPMDPVTERVQQFFYVPNRGSHYEWTRKTDGRPWGGTAVTTRAQQLVDLAIQRKAADPERTLTRERITQQGPLLEEFNRRYPIEAIFEHYGFIPQHSASVGRTDWHHPHQSSKSYGTTTKPDGRWLTSSDTVRAMMGRNGGDSFDVWVAMEFDGDYIAAFKTWSSVLAAELREKHPFIQAFTCNGRKVRVGQ